jgi:putative endonuclease
VQRRLCHVGSTTNLALSVEQHHVGGGAAYTRRRRPVRLVYAEEFASVVDAFAFEKQVQGWSRRKRQVLIEGRRDDLPAMSRSEAHDHN